MNPFDFVNDLTQHKKDLIRSSDDPESAEKKYPAFMVNKAMSYYADTVMHANEMNRNAHLDHLLQHDYYLASVRPKKRFSKWHKPDVDDTLRLIAEAYNININRAREYLSMLTPDEIDTIKRIRSKGGRE